MRIGGGSRYGGGLVEGGADYCCGGGMDLDYMVEEVGLEECVYRI